MSLQNKSEEEFQQGVNAMPLFAPICSWPPLLTCLSLAFDLDSESDQAIEGGFQDMLKIHLLLQKELLDPPAPTEAMTTHPKRQRKVLGAQGVFA